MGELERLAVALRAKATTDTNKPSVCTQEVDIAARRAADVLDRIAQAGGLAAASKELKDEVVKVWRLMMTLDSGAKIRKECEATCATCSTSCTPRWMRSAAITSFSDAGSRRRSCSHDQIGEDRRAVTARLLTQVETGLPPRQRMTKPPSALAASFSAFAAAGPTADTPIGAAAFAAQTEISDGKAAILDAIDRLLALRDHRACRTLDVRRLDRGAHLVPARQVGSRTAYYHDDRAPCAHAAAAGRRATRQGGGCKVVAMALGPGRERPVRRTPRQPTDGTAA